MVGFQIGCIICYTNRKFFTCPFLVSQKNVSAAIIAILHSCGAIEPTLKTKSNDRVTYNSFKCCKFIFRFLRLGTNIAGTIFTTVKVKKVQIMIGYKILCCYNSKYYFAYINYLVFM